VFGLLALVAIAVQLFDVAATEEAMSHSSAWRVLGNRGWGQVGNRAPIRAWLAKSGASNRAGRAHLLAYHLPHE
jgi:hypothetical protein